MKNYLSKLLLMIKNKNADSITECLKKIVTEINEKKDEYRGEGIEVIKIMIHDILAQKIGKREAKELINELDGGEKKMGQLFEMVEKENKYLINKGKKEEKRKIALNMLKEKMALGLIEKITGLSIIEIQNLSKKV